jgi:hypothetical protein
MSARVKNSTVITLSGYFLYGYRGYACDDFINCTSLFNICS